MRKLSKLHKRPVPARGWEGWSVLIGHSEESSYAAVGTASTFFIFRTQQRGNAEATRPPTRSSQSPHYLLFSRLCRTTRPIVRFGVGSSALRWGSCDKEPLLRKRFRDRSWQA